MATSLLRTLRLASSSRPVNAPGHILGSRTTATASIFSRRCSTESDSSPDPKVYIIHVMLPDEIRKFGSDEEVEGWYNTFLSGALKLDRDPRLLPCMRGIFSAELTCDEAKALEKFDECLLARPSMTLQRDLYLRIRRRNYVKGGAIGTGKSQ